MPPRKPALDAAIEERIVLVLFDLANHLQRRGERLAAEAGITTLQWLVLLQIAGDPNFSGERKGPVLASDIARERGLSKPTISAVVNALKDRGLIREERDVDDARRRHLIVTAEGADVVAKIEPHRRAANRRLLADLSAPDRRKLLMSLESCLGVLWSAYEDDRLAVAQSRLTRSR